MRSVLPLLLLAPLCASLPAQGLILGPDGPQPRPTPLPPGQRPAALVHVTRTAIHGEIVDGVATTVIDQVFRNDGGREAEGTWILPLPRGAVADGFTMTVGGKEVKGEVLDAGQARNVYESIVRRRRDPGLLEYAGEGLLRARIYPIPANGEVGVTVRLRQVLEPLGGVYQWQWPLRSMQMGDAGTGPIALDVSIKSKTALATVFAPFGGAEIRREGEHRATVTLEGTFAELENLEVYYGLTQQDFGLHLLTHRQTGDAGYFAMLVSPPRELADDKEIPRRCVQFVVDTSGSMKGDKIEQAKAALRTFLRSLRPVDVFQVVTFASSVQTFFEQPVAASKDNLDAAMGMVDRLNAMGGTNISGALQQALEANLPTGDDAGALLPQIVFVTDGEPTMGLTNPQQILALTKQLDKRAMRLFALGVGDQIDVRLIDDLVQQHHGARDFVGNKEKIEAKVDALCRKIAQPAMTDVVVRCDGIDVFDVHPTTTRDLFCGEVMQITGRYRGEGKKLVRVRGKQNGKDREFVFEVEFPTVAADREFVQTLWARQHVAALLDAIRRGGQRPELIMEVRSLATRYGIVTPYTSQLIVEEGMRLAGRESAFDSNQWNSAVGLGAAPTPGGGRGAPTGPTTVARVRRVRRRPPAPRPLAPAAGSSGSAASAPARRPSPRARRRPVRTTSTSAACAARPIATPRAGTPPRTVAARRRRPRCSSAPPAACSSPSAKS
ncbi:MAG: VWA domain-containing protein [Planctomycetes bacterium]|nr:VWA domain-containing protein [Planctomycetota bacterium]